MTRSVSAQHTHFVALHNSRSRFPELTRWSSDVQDFAMQIAMMELGVRKERVLFHGNLETLRDMTDVRDSSRVMVCCCT